MEDRTRQLGADADAQLDDDARTATIGETRRCGRRPSELDKQTRQSRARLTAAASRTSSRSAGGADGGRARRARSATTCGARGGLAALRGQLEAALVGRGQAHSLDQATTDSVVQWRSDAELEVALAAAEADRSTLAAEHAATLARLDAPQARTAATHPAEATRQGGSVAARVAQPIRRRLRGDQVAPLGSPPRCVSACPRASTGAAFWSPSCAGAARPTAPPSTWWCVCTTPSTTFGDVSGPWWPRATIRFT